MNKTNWSQIIKDLKTYGVTQGRIGKRVGLSQGAISQLKKGAVSEPRYSEGVRLLEFYEEVKKGAEDCQDLNTKKPAL